MTSIDVVRPKLSLRALVLPGLQAFGHHWLPFVILELSALLLVVGYFKVPAIASACGYISELKQNGGLLFVIIATPLAGAILPEIVKRLVVRKGEKTPLRDVLITAGFFAGCGVIVDLQYRLFTLTMGSGTDWGTVITKMVVDQFITTPAYGVPYWVIVYSWKRHHFRILPVLKMISLRWYITEAFPLLVSSWLFWIPMVLMIYSLPANLQFSLFSLAMAAYSLIMVFVATRRDQQ